MPTAGRSAGRALWVRSLRRATTATGDGGSSSLSALKLADAAAPVCLERADRNPDEVELLINAGVHLDESISEPAIASLIQENIGANPVIQPGAGQEPADVDLLIATASVPGFAGNLASRLGVTAARVASLWAGSLTPTRRRPRSRSSRRGWRAHASRF